MAYDIVTIDGDGIGPEVCQATIAVLLQDAQRVETAVEEVLAQGIAVPADQGGNARCSEFTQAVLRQLR